MAEGVGRLRRLKYQILSGVPGRRGAHHTKKLGATRRAEVETAFDAALAAAGGRVCIDLGANAGEYTTMLADRAAKVYAFEPDPWTAALLRENLAGCDNVEIVEAAAGAAAGRMPIYRSTKFGDDPTKASLASTLLPEKTNVQKSASAEVDVVDFRAFAEGLDTDIWLLKIDIEGGEVELLERLLDHPVLDRIDYILVETHETGLPSLAARTRALRRRAARLARPVIEMDWHERLRRRAGLLSRDLSVHTLDPVEVQL
ncbi:MAG: FkbM family methyltransferase [Pseudomonadota bacterium]